MCPHFLITGVWGLTNGKTNFGTNFWDAMFRFHLESRGGVAETKPTNQEYIIMLSMDQQELHDLWISSNLLVKFKDFDTHTHTDTPISSLSQA